MTLSELVAQPPDVTENPYFDTIKKALQERQRESVSSLIFHELLFLLNGRNFFNVTRTFFSFSQMESLFVQKRFHYNHEVS